VLRFHAAAESAICSLFFALGIGLEARIVGSSGW
jgi:hypothetical protein